MFFKCFKWDITKQCFLNCSFCLNKDERKEDIYKDITTDEILNIIA
ncbi:MAG: hypothetical protein Ta2B_09900 [Termitinemataceae bacterium]|nr:MAG: hypothetical protein Ta2B_09900 [Termitinemataceae bacterium]